jgi:hypothetical protein
MKYTARSYVLKIMAGSTTGSEEFDSSARGRISDVSGHDYAQLETVLDEALASLARSEQYRNEEAERHGALMNNLKTENDQLVNEIQDVVDDLRVMSEKVTRCEGKNANLVEQRDTIAEKFHDIRQGLMTEEEVIEAISLAKAEENCKINALTKEQQRTHAAMKRLQSENEHMQQEIERLRNGQRLLLQSEHAPKDPLLSPARKNKGHVRSSSLFLPDNPPATHAARSTLQAQKFPSFRRNIKSISGKWEPRDSPEAPHKKFGRRSLFARSNSAQEVKYAPWTRQASLIRENSFNLSLM